MPGWLQLFTAAFSGGLIVKLLDILYEEYRRITSGRRDAKAVVDRHLDPLLKSADELVGKIRALAESDFIEIRDFALGPEWRFLDNRSVSSLLYLFAAFWCRVELLRKEGLYVELVRDDRGKQLKAFLDCLESRRIRILDRISQRAIGESMINQRTNSSETIRYVEMAKSYDDDDDFRAWAQLLLNVLSATHADKVSRQKVLRYGTILHAMIDTLDPKHYATKQRPSFPNKLSSKSRRDIKFRVFGVYVPYVKNQQKYYGKIGR